MSRQPYADFIENFAYISPYELEHLCDSLLVAFEQYSEDHDPVQGITTRAIKQVLTKTMRQIEISLATARIEEAKLQLKRAQERTYTPPRLSEADFAAFAERKPNGFMAEAA